MLQSHDSHEPASWNSLEQPDALQRIHMQPGAFSVSGADVPFREIEAGSNGTLAKSGGVLYCADSRQNRRFPNHEKRPFSQTHVLKLAICQLEHDES